VPRRTAQTRIRVAPRRLPKARLDELVEEALVDAYGESEQRVAFLTMLEEHLACPFTTEVLGQSVQVERVDLDEHDEIVVVCRRGRTRQRIPILNLRLPPRLPVGWEWVAAYRHWARGQR
jgi:Calcium binding